MSMSTYKPAIKQGPLTMEEMRRQAKENNGLVTGAVFVSLDAIIDGNLETFLDILSEKLTGSTLLSGTDYEFMPHSSSADSLCFKVTGDVSLVLEEGDDAV